MIRTGAGAGGRGAGRGRWSRRLGAEEKKQNTSIVRVVRATSASSASAAAAADSDGLGRAGLAGEAVSSVGSIRTTLGPTKPPGVRGPALRCADTKHSQKAGPFSVARLKIDLPFSIIASRTTALTGEVQAPRYVRAWLFKKHSDYAEWEKNLPDGVYYNCFYLNGRGHSDNAVATEGCGLQGLCPHTAGEVASRSAHISSAALTDIGVCAVQEHNEGTQVSGRWAVTR